MYIPQLALNEIDSALAAGKVLVVFGPRQVGKTTLLQQYLQDKDSYLFVSGEDIHVQELLGQQSIEKLQQFVVGKWLLVIDEAQAVPGIGLALKLLHDHCPDLKIIATGSSSFDLAKSVGEPLTGRKVTLQLFPLSQMELGAQEDRVATKANLSSRLIYGAYPEIVLEQDEQIKQQRLSELVSSYLFKDILQLEGVRQSGKITRLLQLLAMQIGKPVSISELGQQLGMDSRTVDRYLDLLVKNFVLITLGGFSRNLRKEISKNYRFYFYDLGVRNALLNQYNDLAVRSDVGALWENYLVLERLKKQAYQKLQRNNYFWRTYDQQEIDWVEEYDGQLDGYEFKWSQQKVKVPAAWSKNYPQASFAVITPDNYLDFIV